ncbi:MAG: site-specific integrase [archaeon]
MDGGENYNFHGYERRLCTVLWRINPVKFPYERSKAGHPRPPFELTSANVELMQKFYVDIVNEGLTKPRIVSLLDQTCRMLVWLGKDWSEASIDDIKQIVNRVRNADFTEHTKSDYLCKIKQFDKWFSGGEYSAKTKWIKTTMKARCYKLPNQLITPEEAQILIDSTRSARDRAIVHLLWETGARVGEIANLKIADLAFNKGECQVNLYGKTGSRRVLLLESVRDLQNHIKTRQAKSPDDFVFLLNGTTNFGAPITYSSIKKIMVSAIKDTQLPKKIYPHLFRHSRASYLASKGLSEAQLCSIFGWVLGSKQVRTYIHLSLQQVQDAYKQIYGIKKIEETKNDLIKCQVCDEMNFVTNDCCQNCYNPLTIQGALKVKQEKELIQQDRDTLQKIYAEAFRLATEKKLSLEEAQIEATKNIAIKEVQTETVKLVDKHCPEMVVSRETPKG